MRALTIPKQDQPALAALMALPRSDHERLVAFLKSAPVTLNWHSLAPALAEALNTESRVAESLLHILATLHAVHGTDHEWSDLTSFADELIRAAEEAGNENLKPPDRRAFRDNIVDLLSVESFFVSSRALQITREHEHVMCESRVLTDLRPVFGVQDEPAATVISHTLRIKYHRGNRKETGDFFVALNGDDVTELIAQLQRAKRKERAISGLCGNANLPVLTKSDES